MFKYRFHDLIKLYYLIFLFFILSWNNFPSIFSKCYADNEKFRLSVTRENVDTTFFSFELIVGYVNYPTFVDVADLDGDYDGDVIVAHGGGISWFENKLDSNIWGQEQFVGYISNPREVYSADLDSDSDMDLVTASCFDDQIVWYENYNGLGNFQQHNFPSFSGGWKVLFIANIDGDNDQDVIVGSSVLSQIVWFENIDGHGNFTVKHPITTSVWGPRSLYAEDVDNDNDMDIFVADQYDNKILWFENIDGFGNFGSPNVIDTADNVIDPFDILACDIDGDSDKDVLSNSNWNNKVVWYENMDGAGNFGTQNIISDSALRPRSVYASDLDNDNDIDVLSASGGDGKLVWFENLDGNGTFRESLIGMGNDPWDIFATDIDGDEKTDVLSGVQHKIIWFQNGGPTTNINKPITNLPDKIGVRQNFPNPFNPLTQIRYSIPTSQNVTITLYNILGQKIKTLLSQKQTAGEHMVIWDARDDSGQPVSSGIYFYQLRAGDFTETKKMMLMR